MLPSLKPCAFIGCEASASGPSPNVLHTLGSVDASAVRLYPMPYVFHDGSLLFVDGAISLDGDIEQQVAVFRNNIHQHPDGL